MEHTEHMEKPFDKGELAASASEEFNTHLPDDQIREIIEAARSQDSDTVYAALDDLSPVDAAELLSKIKEEDRQELLAMYGEALDPQIYTAMNPELRRSALSSMPAAYVANILSMLESDDALGAD